MAAGLKRSPAPHDAGATTADRLPTCRHLRTSVRAGDQLAVPSGGDSGDQAHGPFVCLNSEKLRGDRQLADNPRIHVHFTPTSGSWLNLVEVWFGIIQRQAIGRGTFTSVTDLITKIRAFINSWNQRSHPFTWTKTPDQVLAKANRQKTSNTSH